MKNIPFDSSREFKDVFVRNEDAFSELKNILSLNVTVGENSLDVEGSDSNISVIESFVSSLVAFRAKGVSPSAVAPGLLQYYKDHGNFVLTNDMQSMMIRVGPGRSPVVPRTLGQINYLNVINNNDITLVSGAAGSGKTYLAMAVAISHLLNNKCERIILTRPALESGENLGFLPGTIDEKFLPYLRPLYDAMSDMLEEEDLDRLTRKNKIEIAPLAYMRGRTLSNCFVILDEAQNTTKQQMLMFLTRIGNNSKCVVCGDGSQVDLHACVTSGLRDSMQRLDGIRGIGMYTMSLADVVRHRLVREIIKAYDDNNRQNERHDKWPFGAKKESSPHDNKG